LIRATGRERTDHLQGRSFTRTLTCAAIAIWLAAGCAGGHAGHARIAAADSGATRATTWVVSGDSMTPTLAPGAHITVNAARPIRAGEIVVLGNPAGIDPGATNDLVKRVIGVPGETVQGLYRHVYVNMRPRPEPYLPSWTTTDDFGPTNVPPDSYFVMGDNRRDSRDSRDFGPIPRRDIVGVVTAIRN
jgi:signal peptidase I